MIHQFKFIDNISLHLKYTYTTTIIYQPRRLAHNLNSFPLPQLNSNILASDKLTLNNGTE
ncbi:unnamed protein product [Musa acuminata subsp. burmannicoides]